MHWLTGYELRKTWGRKSFLASLCLLFFLNLFLLWYHNLPGEGKPGLAAYKRFQEKINGMTETEKENYVSNLKETMDGVGFVEEVLMMRNMSDEMGDILAQQLLGENPGLFEAWYEKYQSGEYLQLTDSLRQEALLVSELHAQWEKSAGYGEYLEAVQETEDTLGSIGIFRKTEENSFSTENIRKSAADYAGLTADGISWMPDKAVTGSMENLWTDILLVLSVFFFVGSLILEEKEKSLFYITRSTKFGIFRSICAKILALLFHCMAGASRSSVRLQSALFRKCSGIWGPECKAAVTGGLQGQHLVRQHPGIYRDIGGHKGCGTVRIWDTSDGTVYFGGYGLSALPGGRHAVGTEFSVIYCHPGCRKEESV